VIDVDSCDDLNTFLAEASLHLASELTLHVREHMTGSLEDRHVNASMMEDLAPLQRNIPSAEHDDTLGEIAAFENRLASVVGDLIQPLNGSDPRRTPGGNKHLLTGDSHALVLAVDNLDDCILSKSPVASVDIRAEVLSHVDVVLSAELAYEFVLLIERSRPVERGFTIAVLNGIERVVWWLECSLADLQKVLARNATDVDTGPTEGEPRIHDRRREPAFTGLSNRGERSRTTPKDHEIVLVSHTHFNTRFGISRHHPFDLSSPLVAYVGFVGRKLYTQTNQRLS